VEIVSVCIQKEKAERLPVLKISEKQCGLLIVRFGFTISSWFYLEKSSNEPLPP